MKNKLLKTLLPLTTIASFATLPAIVSCGEKKPEEIFISNAPKEMLLNEELTLIVTSSTGKAYNDVTWSSSEREVISIDETTGTIKALKKGESTITAQSDKYPDISTTCLIKVVDAFEYDLTKQFEPKLPTLKGKLDPEAATSTYLKNAAITKAIIADDLVFTWYQVKIREQGYTKISIKAPMVDVANSLISIEYHSEGEVPTTGDVMTSQDIKFENFPISVIYMEEETPYTTKWAIAPNIGESAEWLFEDENWHFYQEDNYQSSEPLIHDWNKEKLINDPSGLNIIVLALMFSFPSLSYYLSETTPV